ncbi:hypothetical protein fh0823_08350 [Francisella halioticida]|nr:hypothetical protein fh0823_08350 [Francisella halioticida]
MVEGYLKLYLISSPIKTPPNICVFPISMHAIIFHSPCFRSTKLGFRLSLLGLICAYEIIKSWSPISHFLAAGPFRAIVLLLACLFITYVSKR